MKLQRSVVMITSVGLLLAGCASDDPNRRAKTGAAVGAIAGAVIGHQIDHKSGRFVGAAVGALAGAGVGHYMDNQQKEMEQQLAAEREANAIEIERMQDDTLKLTLDSEVSFDFNSTVIRPSFQDSLDKLAQVILKYDRTVVHVVGHTDNIGSMEYNQRLSERRAEAVASYLALRGVPWNRMQTEGRAFREPRAENATEAGRQLNRRVELYLKPIVEGSEGSASEPPRYY